MKSLHLASKMCNVGKPTETRRLCSKNLLCAIRTPFVRQAKRLQSKNNKFKERTTYDRKVRIGAQLTNGKSSILGNAFYVCSGCLCQLVNFVKKKNCVQSRGGGLTRWRCSRRNMEGGRAGRRGECGSNKTLRRGSSAGVRSMCPSHLS